MQGLSTKSGSALRSTSTRQHGDEPACAHLQLQVRDENLGVAPLMRTMNA